MYFRFGACDCLPVRTLYSNPQGAYSCRIFLPFMQPCIHWDKFTPDCFFKTNFSLILPVCSVGPPENGLFRYLTNTLYLSCISLISPLYATCHTHFTLDSLTMQYVVKGANYESWHYAVFSTMLFLHLSDVQYTMCHFLLLHIQVFVSLCSICIQQAICMSWNLMTHIYHEN